MTKPSKERIAAALALADAADDHFRGVVTSGLISAQLKAYRATAPKKPRTRSGVDAEIVGLVRYRLGGGPYNSASVCMDLVKLCAEPVTDDAPEQDELTEARAKIAELERARDSLIDTGATLRADNERFAHQLLEARNKIEHLQGELEAAEQYLKIREQKPCERRHLTEAEEALCEYAEERARPVYILNWPLLSDLINTVRDERRQQTKTMGGAEAAAMRSEEHRAPASAAPPAEPSGSSIFPEDDDDPEPERCSCEEAEKLKRIVEIERRTSRELAQKIRDAIEVLS